MARLERLRGLQAAEVALARVSGGKYGLLGENARVDPERVLALFERPCVVDGQSLMIQPYIGLERLTEADGGGADVLKNATIALSRARGERRQHWQYFTREMQTTAQERLALLHDLRHATEAKRGLSLVYQPQVEIASGKICGAEALLRWQNVRGQNIPPDRFIPVAEYSHLIIELGEWVLRSACEQLGEWDRAGVSGLRMSVNVSLVQFRDPDFVAMARRCILDHGQAVTHRLRFPGCVGSAQRAGIALDQRHRCLQLVGDDADKGGLHLLSLAEASNVHHADDNVAQAAIAVVKRCVTISAVRPCTSSRKLLVLVSLRRISVSLCWTRG